MPSFDKITFVGADRGVTQKNDVMASMTYAGVVSKRVFRSYDARSGSKRLTFPFPNVLYFFSAPYGNSDEVTVQEVFFRPGFRLTWILKIQVNPFIGPLH